MHCLGLSHQPGLNLKNETAKRVEWGYGIWHGTNSTGFATGNVKKMEEVRAILCDGNSTSMHFKSCALDCIIPDILLLFTYQWTKCKAQLKKSLSINVDRLLKSYLP